MDASDLSLTAFLKRQKVRKGKALLIGSRVYGESDRRTMYPDCDGLDMQDGPTVDIVHNLEKPLPKGRVYKHIDCCSVLEHVERPWLMAENIERALVSGGTLLVSVPFVWRLHGYPGDYWRMSPDALRVLFKQINWDEISFMARGETLVKPRSIKSSDGKWFERTEVFGFGRKI